MTLCAAIALFTCSLPVFCLVPDTNVCTVCVSGNPHFQPLILDLWYVYDLPFKAKIYFPSLYHYNMLKEDCVEFFFLFLS